MRTQNGESAGKRLTRRERGRRAERRAKLAGWLAVIPFLLVCLCFVLGGVEELIPDTGLYGMLWTAAAVLILLFAVYTLAVRTNDAPERAAERVETPKAAAKPDNLSGAELLRLVDALIGPQPRSAVESEALDLAGFDPTELAAEDFVTLDLAGLEAPELTVSDASEAAEPVAEKADAETEFSPQTLFRLWKPSRAPRGSWAT